MPKLTPEQEGLCEESRWDFSDLSALYINCTLKRSPEVSHTQGLADLSIAIMQRNGVAVETIRAVRVLRGVGGCLITGNEDGAKHCAMNILYSLQHLGYAIPPQADSAWLEEAGPRAELPRPGLGRVPTTTSPTATRRSWPGTCSTSRGCSRTPAASRPTATSARSGTLAVASTSRTRTTADRARRARAVPRLAYSAPNCASTCSMPSTKIVTCPAGCPHAARPRGSPPSEVCELLGLTEANQRVPLHRARSRVRAALLPLMEVSR